MKKLLPLLLCILLLCGCAASNIQQVTLGGYDLTVDLQGKTITHGTDVYTFEQKNLGVMETVVTIHYPNGVTYRKTFTFEIVVAGGSSTFTDGTDLSDDDGTYTGDHDENRYLPGPLLAKAANQASAMKEKQEKENKQDAQYLIYGIFLLLIGLFILLFPEACWHLRHWWCVEGGEPSELYLIGSRISGVLGIAIGVILLLMAIF